MVSFYPTVVLEAKPGASGEVRPAIDEVCESIRKATKGWGADKSELLDVVGGLSPSDRFHVFRRYPEIYGGQDLEKLMKSEVGSNDFGLALQLLTLPNDLADVKIIKQCTAGLGTTEHVLYQVICGRTTKDIDLLKKAWFNKYSSDLGLLLASELSGDFKLIMFACLQGIEQEYDTAFHTQEKAEADAEMFYKAGQKRWGTDEQKLINIICHSPAEYLRVLNYAYVDKYGYNLAKALEKELGGDAREAAIYHVNMKLKPYEAAAAQIKKACAGFGTDEFALTCCIAQYHLFLKKVDEAHSKAYDKSISKRIASEVGGNFKKVLTAIVENAPY